MLAGCASVKQQENFQSRMNQTDARLDNHTEVIERQVRALEAFNEAQSQMLSQLSRIDKKMSVLERRVGEIKMVQHQMHHPAPKLGSGDTAVAPKDTAIHAQEKVVMGRVEWVWLELLGKNIKGRIDTGAKSSSLHATNIVHFERDGEPWVRFNLAIDPLGEKKQTLVLKKSQPEEPATDKDAPGTYEAPLQRSVKIKQASLNGDTEERPVVRLKLRVGGIYEEADFTLADRDNMLYPILIGRNFLRDLAMVDVAKVFTQKKFHP